MGVARRIALAAVAWTAVAACSDDGPARPIIGEARSAIEGGARDETTTHVLGMVNFDEASYSQCSGTLIAPNVVLTAQHCIAESTSSPSVFCGETVFTRTYAPDATWVTTEPDVFEAPLPSFYRSQTFHVPSEDDACCGLDVALIVLERSVEGAVPAIPRVDLPLESGEPYIAIGYGQQGENGPSGVRQRREGLNVTCVGTDCEAASTVTDTEFEGDIGVCSGDSGGPALDEQGRVVGIASRGASGCRKPVYGHVFSHGAWIQQIVAQATAEAGLPTPLWALGHPTDIEFNQPVGATCATGADCPSGLCADGICSRTCTENALCPEGFSCGEAGQCETAVEWGSGAEAPPTDTSGCAVCTPRPTGRLGWLLGVALGLGGARRRRMSARRR